MEIDGMTRVTGLFGYPVEHTLSPAMHNAAFAHLGMNYRYLPFLVRPEELPGAVQAVRSLDLAGVNVTVPHKEAVIPLLDTVHGEASFIGAVNTVVNSRGVLTGYNTDGRGFMKSLEESGIGLKDKSVFIAGAGGASRAISYYISAVCGSLSLYDTDTGKLERLVSDLSQTRQNVTALREHADISTYDVLINATPLGLEKDDPLPFDVSALSGRHTVCDLIYRETGLLRKANALGCRTANGLGMLLWQGALAFELWTGVLPPVEVMKKALISRFSS